MSRKQKKSLTLIIISLCLLAAGFIVNTGNVWLNAILPFAAYLVAGLSVLKKATVNIAHGQVFDENFLMAIATIGAIAILDFKEAAAVMIFYQVGELFENIAVGKSRKSIKSLMQLRPDKAFIERDGVITEVDPAEVKAGDTIVVKAGERIPLDGVVISGESSLDTSALTGESVPRTVKPGDTAASGCVNISGTLRIRTTGGIEESTVSRILALVEESAESKARAESFVTRFAKVYTPIVVGLAVAIAVIPSIITLDFAKWVQRALIFLVVSCPCALVISVPLTFFGAIGGASKKGVLFKGSVYIERLAKADSFFFDKTGTLTAGKFTVSRVVPQNCSEEHLKAIALTAEKYSNHPLALSVRETFKDTNCKEPENCEEISGYGIKCSVDGKTVYAGNAGLMKKAGAESLQPQDNETAIHICEDGRYIGFIALSDSPKKGSSDAVKQLKKLGAMHIAMLTGDRKKAALKTAEIIGLDEVHAELLPQDKAKIVSDYIKGHDGITAFTGDGINDAPVLALSDVGIAMGGLGSDAAIEAADVIIMDDDPLKIPKAVKISRASCRIVKENIIFALGVKIAVMVLGALGLAGMWLAVFADVGVSVLAIINAMRMLKAE